MHTFIYDERVPAACPESARPVLHRHQRSCFLMHHISVLQNLDVHECVGFGRITAVLQVFRLLKVGLPAVSAKT